MSIRPHPSRQGAWQIDVGYGKNRQRIPFEGTRDAAIEMEAMLKRSMRKTPANCIDRTATLIDRYLESYKIDHQPSGYEKQYRCCKILKRFFGKHLLQHITTQMVEEFKQARIGEGVKPATVQKELCALSGLFKWAEEQEIIDDIPCKIKKFRTKMIRPPEETIPSQEEAAKLLAEIPSRIRGLFSLMVKYGLRKSEAFNLREGDYNIERRILTITGKGGKIRHIPIVDQDSHAELQTRSKNAIEGWLWYSARNQGPYRDLRGTLKSAAQRAGISQNMHNHLLRHLCFTDLVEHADLRTTQLIAGHSSIATTEKYLHRRADRLRLALEKHLGED
jgi:integrase/recombinase XerC